MKENPKVLCNYTFKKLAKMWLNQITMLNYSPIAIKSYKCNLKNWILPELGNCKIQSITPFMINNYLCKLKIMESRFSRQKDHRLSLGSFKKIYTTIKTILSYAYRNDLIKSNPCTKIKLNYSMEPNKSLHYWDSATYEKVTKLLKKEKNTDNALVIEFAVKTRFTS